MIKFTVARFCGAAATICAVSSGSMYLRKKLEERIFEMPLCQSAIEQLRTHKQSLEALGSPISCSRPMLRNVFNLVTVTDATVALPVSGPKASGNLLIVASKEKSEKDWTLNSLKLEIAKGKEKVNIDL